MFNRPPAHGISDSPLNARSGMAFRYSYCTVTVLGAVTSKQTYARRSFGCGLGNFSFQHRTDLLDHERGNPAVTDIALPLKPRNRP